MKEIPLPLDHRFGTPFLGVPTSRGGEDDLLDALAVSRDELHTRIERLIEAAQDLEAQQMAVVAIVNDPHMTDSEKIFALKALLDA